MPPTPTKTGSRDERPRAARRQTRHNGIDAEAAVKRHEHRADIYDGEQRNSSLDAGLHQHADPVALYDVESEQSCCKTAYAITQIHIRNARDFAAFGFRNHSTARGAGRVSGSIEYSVSPVE